MKTQAYNLDKMLKKHKFYYIHSDINSKNFPVPDVIETENPVIIKMEKDFTSQEALDEIKKRGCRPANIYELLLYVENHPEGFQRGKYIGVAAFGSYFIDSDGRHRVPFVDRDSDGGWEFFLGNFEGAWRADFCLVCFCDKTLNTQTLENPLTLENVDLNKAIETVKSAGYKVIKEY
jgi:hypothetical protein